MNTLRDLGEREIVRSVLPEYCSTVGDDCAVLDAGHYVALTTDPVPEPVSRLIGNDADAYWYGRLLTTINMSDLAAAGARPLAFVAAIEAPPDLSINTLRRFLLGISEGCKAEGAAYVGGNLREAGTLGAVGTALGQLERGHALRRRGADPGDILVSVGVGGVFWRDALILRNGGIVEPKENSPVFCPRSQSLAMHELAINGLVKAAIDNSDGLLPALTQMAEANNLAIAVDLDKLLPPDDVRELDVDPARLWLGWGDWNIIAAVAAENIEEAKRLAMSSHSSLIPIGEFERGDPRVILRRLGRSATAPRLESERFSIDSLFSTGIDEYVRHLLDIKLP